MHKFEFEYKITLGTVLTIFAFIATFATMWGGLSGKIKANEVDSNLALQKAYENEKRVAVLESQITQGFEHIENLLINDK
jgi:hypothetical protein